MANARGARRHSLIPWLFPAAMLPMFAANGALIYFAARSAPAVVADRPFETGRTYNRDLAAAAAQQRLGWSAVLDTQLLRASIPSPIVLDIRDRAGAPVAGLAVELRVWRPVGASPDQRLRLAETEPGHYAAAPTFPAAGQWQLDIVAKRGEEEFALGRRVIVR